MELILEQIRRLVAAGITPTAIMIERMEGEWTSTVILGDQGEDLVILPPMSEEQAEALVREIMALGQVKGYRRFEDPASEHLRFSVRPAVWSF